MRTLRAPEGMSLREVTEHLFLEDAPEPADLIFVFAGSNPGRAERAAELYQAGHAPRILFTGGHLLPGRQREADFQAGLAKKAGVPEEAILVETRSANTVENVVAARELLAQQGLLETVRTVLLVSAPYHMRRALLTFQHHFPGVRVLCCPNAGTVAQRASWWHSEDGRQLVFRELEKVHAYHLKGNL